MTDYALALVGRTEDSKQLGDLLTERSLVTLVGPGGIGKTTLANAVSRDLANQYSGGVHVAELSGTSDDDDIQAVVARQFGVETLPAFALRAAGAETLILLDNCESALNQARNVVTDLLQNEGITVLATSRSPLYAANERIYPLQPLAVPVDDIGDDGQGQKADGTKRAAAVQLFLDRATQAGARWEHTEENLRAVGRLVRRLNGLPLAIELAAARTRALSPGELADMMEQQLDLLARPGQSEDRHHSLRTAIGASYEPLSDVLKRFFRMLTVMAAPFDLKLAHAVAGQSESEIDSLDLLTELIDTSLIDVRTDADGITKYRFLDSIRAYGLEQLNNADEAAATEERYVDAVTAMADDIVMAALESFTPEVLGQIRDQFVHLANAIGWCLLNDDSPARSYRLFVPFYGPTGARAEVSELARRVRSRWSEPAPLQAEAWAVMGTATFFTGDYQSGTALSAEAANHPDATSLAKLMAHRTQGFMASLNGDTKGAKEHLDLAIEYAIPFSASFARDLQISRSVVIVDKSESPAALEVLSRVGQESAKADEPVMMVWSAVTAAYHHALLDDLGAARRAADAAVAVADDTGMAWSVSTAHRVMGSVRIAADGWQTGAPHMRRALDSSVGIGDAEGAAMVLRAAAGGARFLDQEDLAHDLWSTVPPVGGLPVIPSIFHTEIAALESELGVPTPIDSASLVRKARRLLGPVEPDVNGAETNGMTTGAAIDDGIGAAAGGEPGQSNGGAAGDGVQPNVQRFLDCELDRAMHELRRNGERVHIEPQVYDVLAYLVERRGSVVTKHELMDEVWGDRFVSDAALSSRIKSVRAATGDDGKAQRVVRTVHGKGFTFVPDVT